MANEPTLFQGNLPAEKVTGSLRALGAARTQVGGLPFLKMGKDGVFVWGVDGVEVSEDERWAVNPATFMIGVIGWKGGQVIGEQMFPITSGQRVNYDELEPIETGNPADGWKEQITVQLKQMETSDEVVFKTTSVGGKNAMSKLADTIAAQMEENPARPVPVVQLKNDSYRHKEYGKIYTPEFEVVDWVDVNGKKPRGRPKKGAEERRELV